jgi:hypothetical protein
MERFHNCSGIERIMNEDGQRTSGNPALSGNNAYAPTVQNLLPPQGGVRPNNCDPFRAQALSAGGCLVGLGDGSVRNVSTSVSPATWRNAMLPDDGNVLGSDW